MKIVDVLVEKYFDEELSAAVTCTQVELLGFLPLYRKKVMSRERDLASNFGYEFIATRNKIGFNKPNESSNTVQADQGSNGAGGDEKG